MKIVFMGTPEFAVPTLEILYDAGYEIAAVVTSPDRYGGRGRKTLIESDVKKYARSKNLNILQPEKLRSAEFNQELENINADLQIVVAFRMLPEMVWNRPPLGTYNLHGSLLPAYRGAAPINWAIIKGEKITGVSCFKLKHEIDTGSILLQKEIPIYNSDTAGDLHDRMMYIAAETVLESVKRIENGKVVLQEQDNSLVSHAPKLNKENTEIDFKQSTEAVYNFIRGLSPYPGAWIKFEGKELKIFKAAKNKQDHKYKPGTIHSDNRSYISIACMDGFIDLDLIQYPGKRKMEVSSFLNGFEIKNLGE